MGMAVANKTGTKAPTYMMRIPTRAGLKKMYGVLDQSTAVPQPAVMQGLVLRRAATKCAATRQRQRRAGAGVGTASTQLIRAAGHPATGSTARRRAPRRARRPGILVARCRASRLRPKA
jgi:hypothetical protein